MAQPWVTEVFSNVMGGVSSAVDADLLPPQQQAWAINTSIRGGKFTTRPPFIQKLVLPPGLVQGASYFSVQGGMMIASIAGNLYRIDVNNEVFRWEQIELDHPNSGVIHPVFMCQTVESLVIQDGQSYAIIYDGSSAVRSNPAIPQVPMGRQMAYGNGRLWVAVNRFNLVAGDIRTTVPGSELSFIENTYFAGGGAFYFPNGINGLAFAPVIGEADYGPLVVFGDNVIDSVRADITFREQWQTTPAFVSIYLRSIGGAGQDAIREVNQDLFWRDSDGGIRSLNSASTAAYFAQYLGVQGDANTPVSREVSRIVDYESTELLDHSSIISFNNWLLVSASPYLNVNHGVSFRDIVVLDFAPVSSMGQRATPAYAGTWQGVNTVKLLEGQFGGQKRAFAISTDPDGMNRLWEIDPGRRDDQSATCTSDTPAVLSTPIECVVETSRRNFSLPKNRKRLERCDVYLDQIAEDVTLTVFWRTDNNQQWQQWDEIEVCAQLTDPPSGDPHVFKNLATQQRPQIKTFTIPDAVDQVTAYQTSIGFEFQLRLVWTGSLRVQKVLLHAIPVDDQSGADRDILTASCLQYDVTGNDIVYSIPLGAVSCGLSVDAGPDQSITSLTGTFAGSVSYTGSGALQKQWQMEYGPGAVSYVDQTSPTTDFTVTQPGTYKFRLFATDGTTSALDEVVFTISSAPFTVTADSPYLIAHNSPDIAQWTTPDIHFTPHNANGAVTLVSCAISGIQGYVWNDIRTSGINSSFIVGVSGVVNQSALYDFTATLTDHAGGGSNPSPLSCWMFKVVATYQDSIGNTASAETLVAGLTGDSSFISNTLSLSAFTGSGTTSATSNQQTIDLSAMGGQNWSSSYWLGINNANLIDPGVTYSFNFPSNPTTQPVRQSIGVANGSLAEIISGLVFYGIIENDESSTQFWTPIVPVTMTLTG